MRKNNRSNLLLIELIISLLFFSLISAICIRLFVKGKTIDEESLRKAHASMIASNIAETYRSGQLETVFPASSDGTLYFDSSFATTTKERSVFYATLKEEGYTLHITVFSDEKEVFSLACSSYQQKELGKDVVS